MRNPRFQSILVEKVEVCTDHMSERLCALRIVDWLGEKPNVIMAKDIVLPRLVKVFILRRAIQPIVLPQRIVQCRTGGGRAASGPSVSLIVGAGQRGHRGPECRDNR